MARSRIIAGKAVIIIEAQDLVNKTLGKIRGNLHRFSNEVGKIGEGLFRTGFFGAIGSGLVVNSFIKFDDAMRTLRVNLDLFGKSAQQVDRVMRPLEERIRSLAKTTPFNPTEVAGAAATLAKGGFNPQEILDSLQAVLDLARATDSELGSSTTYLINALRTFGIETKYAGEIASQFVRGARKGTLEIEDLATALKYSGSTADNLGVSFQKMIAFFDVLSTRGLAGSIAGTSLNTALSQLTKKAEELAALGDIQLVVGIDKDGNEALDVLKSLENLFKYADTLPFVKQQTLFQDVFNLRGARVIPGIRKGLSEINALTESIANAGDEARVASQIKDAGAGGAFRQLLSTLQDLNIELGKTTEQPFIKITAVIKGLLAELGKVATLNPVLTSLVILSPGILLAAGAGMIALAKGLRLAAYSAGALKSALGPIGRLFSKGTVGQLTALSQLRKATPGGIGAITGAIGSAKNTVVSKVSSASANLAARREATRARRALLASNQRNAVLALKREADATKLITAAQRNQVSSKAKLASSIKQVNVAQARNNSLLADNVQKIKAAQKVEQVRVAEGIATRARASSRLKIDSLIADRARIRQSIAGKTSSKFELDALRFREAGITKEISLARQRAKAIRPVLQPVGVTQETVERLKQRSVLLAKQAKLERVGVALTKGKAAIEGRYVRQLTKGQDVLLSANKAKQAIQAIDLPRKNPINVLGELKSGLGAAKGFSLATATKSIATFGTVFKTVFTGIRRVFSTTGLLTVLEVLILFGDKIPIVKDALAALGSGFSNAFKQIGDIAKYATGPLALLKASIDAFVADRADLGVSGLLSAFSSLASIIGNQLIAAWNKFKEAIAPVYDFVVGLFNVIDLTVKSIIESISTALGSTLNVLSTGFDSLFGTASIEGSSSLSIAKSIVEAIAKLIPSLFNWIASFTVSFNSASEQFIIRLENALSNLNPFNDQTVSNNLADARLKEVRSEAALRQQTLRKNLEETTKGISEAFNTSSLEASKANAAAAIEASKKERDKSLADAQAIREQLARKTIEEQKQAANFNQEITPAKLLENPMVKAMLTIADALVGSAQSTSGNILRKGKPIDEKQLEEQQKQTALLKKIAENDGILLPP